MQKSLKITSKKKHSQLTQKPNIADATCKSRDSLDEFCTILNNYKIFSYNCNSTGNQRYLRRFSLGTSYTHSILSAWCTIHKSHKLYMDRRKDLYNTVHKIANFAQPRNHLLLPTQGAFFKYPYLCAQY